MTHASACVGVTAAEIGVDEGRKPDVIAIEEGLSRCLGAHWNEPTRVSGLQLVPGGAARATWRCDALVGNRRRGLIVRLASSAQLLPSDDHAEFLTTRAAWLAGLPVAERLLFETRRGWAAHSAWCRRFPTAGRP